MLRLQLYTNCFIFTLEPARLIQARIYKHKIRVTETFWINVISLQNIGQLYY